MNVRALVMSYAVLAAAVSAATVASAGDDWPQWRGPERTGLSKETGLLQQWPAGGPPVQWTTGGLGNGYGGVSVSGDRVFVQGAQSGQSAVSALNRADGKVVWNKILGRSLFNDRGSGPRGTPTVDGDRMYVLTENGGLVCLLVKDGSVVWQRNILADFKAPNIPWLISESPL